MQFCSIGHIKPCPCEDGEYEEEKEEETDV